MYFNYVGEYSSLSLQLSASTRAWRGNCPMTIGRRIRMSRGDPSTVIHRWRCWWSFWQLARCSGDYVTTVPYSFLRSSSHCSPMYSYGDDLLWIVRQHLITLIDIHIRNVAWECEKNVFCIFIFSLYYSYWLLDGAAPWNQPSVLRSKLKDE